MSDSNDDYIQSIIENCTGDDYGANTILSELLVERYHLEIDLAATKKELERCYKALRLQKSLRKGHHMIVTIMLAAIFAYVILYI